jgi:hypothetical protein
LVFSKGASPPVFNSLIRRMKYRLKETLLPGVACPGIEFLV